MTALDRDQLLDWLDHRALGQVATAVYHGLADRIRRGQFDTTQRPRKEE